MALATGSVLLVGDVLSPRTLRTQLMVVGFVALIVPVTGAAIVLFRAEEETVGGGTTSVASGSVVRLVVAVAVVGALLALGLVYWWARRVIVPIERIAGLAERISAGSSMERIGATSGPTEVQVLAESFDSMLDRVASSSAEQRAFLEATSHELRTPLAIVRANAQIARAQRAHGSQELIDDALLRIERASDRMGQDLARLLGHSRAVGQRIERAGNDLVSVARSVVDDLGAVAADQGVVLGLVVPDSIFVAIDGESVATAIGNLVDNAILHSGGERVLVEVAVTPSSEPGESRASVSVTDWGSGLGLTDPDDDPSVVFDRYWRGRTTAEGHGIGLAVVREVADAHGAELVVESPHQAGVGCRFTLTFVC